MRGTAQIIRLCTIAAAACFVALVVISKLWIEPEGMVIFDSRLGGYDGDDAQLFLNAISPTQLDMYLGAFRKLDTAFPILLAISLVGTIWLNTGGEKPFMRWVALIGPAAYLALDLAENAMVAKILDIGPAGIENTILRASTYTQAKWMCLALSLLVVVWALRFATKEPVA